MFFTVFPSDSVSTGTRIETAWAFLGQVICCDPPAGREVPKKALPLWSPAVFKEDRRSRETVEAVYALGFDVDVEPVPTESALRTTLAGQACMFHSSSSSTPTAPRWRLLLQLSRPVTGSEYDVIWAIAAQHLPFPVGSAKDPSRGWYMPRVPAEGEFVGVVLPGGPIDADVVLAMAPRAAEPSRSTVAVPAAVAVPTSGAGDTAADEPRWLRVLPQSERERLAAERVAGEVFAPSSENSDGSGQLIKLAGIVGAGYATGLDGGFRVLRAAAFARSHSDARLLRALSDAVSARKVSWGRFLEERGHDRLIQELAGTPPDARPRIEVTFDLAAMVDQGIAALAASEIYQRARGLVTIVRSDGAPGDVIRCAGSPIIKPVSGPALKERLSRAAQWVRHTDEGEKECLPPPDVVSALEARGEWQGIRPLVGIAEAPVLRPGGTVLQVPGYDLETGYLLVPNAVFPTVPDAPTFADAQRARDELLEVVVDFPFETDAHRAAWLAAALTPFARPAIEGCVPLVAIDASTRGTGKSLLSDTVAILAAGREANRTPQPQDDEEMRKRITALIREGETIVVLDNIARPIEYAALDAALTTTQWKDRILGKSESVTAPNRLFWLASGNNLEFRGDVIRRVLHIRIESPLENPENRRDFKHSPLLSWVKMERPRLVCAALTILRAFFTAGCPTPGNVAAWGSFEEWSRVVAGAVIWVGMPDPRSTRINLDATGDQDKLTLGVVIDALEVLGGTGITARELLAAGQQDARLGAFREAVEALPARRQVGPRELGEFLRRFRRRIVRGRMIEATADRTGVNRWRVIAI